MLGRLWRPLLFLGTSYILIAFGRDFVLGALDEKIQNARYAVQYVPFAILTVTGGRAAFRRLPAAPLSLAVRAA